MPEADAESQARYLRRDKSLHVGARARGILVNGHPRGEEEVTSLDPRGWIGMLRYGHPPDLTEK